MKEKEKRKGRMYSTSIRQTPAVFFKKKLIMSFQRWVTRGGDLSNLRLSSDFDPSKAGSNKDTVSVAVTHVGLNLADVFAALGLYSATPEGEFTPGLEFAGIVTSVNVGAKKGAKMRESKVKVGDKVMGVTRFGAYATAVTVPASHVRRVPEGWSCEQVL